MFKTLVNAFKEKEIRNKLLITLGLLFLFVLGTWIPVPGIDSSIFEQATSENTFLSLLSSINGGALTNGAILALGVSPYITSSIIMQLLTIAIPSIEKLARHGGEEGRRKFNKMIRYGALILAIAQAVGIVVAFNSSGDAITDVLFGSTVATAIFVVLALVAGAMFTVWMGEKITEIGIGNGMSLLVFIGILSSASISILDTLITIFTGQATDEMIWGFIIFLVALVVIFALIVFIDLAERRIPVTYAKQVRGRKLMGGQTTELPLKVNSSGVIPIIFASAFLMFPQIIISIFWPTTPFAAFWNEYLGAGSWLYSVLLALFILIFAFFYAQVTFSPEDAAKRIQENGGMVASYRPGKPTVDYLRKVQRRLVLFGAIFLAFIALIPTLIFQAINVGNLVNAFTATGMLIIVSVALEFNKGLEEQMIIRNYKGFLK